MEDGTKFATNFADKKKSVVCCN